MSETNSAVLAAVERLCTGVRPDGMTREMAFNELSQLALTGSPDSVRVKALDVLAARFPDYLDKTHDSEGQEVSVTFTEGKVVSRVKSTDADSNPGPTIENPNHSPQRLLDEPDSP